MSNTLAKILMVIAIACLGNSRQDWARDMLAGFREADEAGHPLAFAFRCLLRALREMPRHAEGRETLSRYAVAAFILLPSALILFSGALAGYPFVHLFGLQPHAAPAWMPGGVNDGNRFSMQTLTVLFLILSARPLITAWFLLECDWARVGTAQRFAAAIITTIAIFTSVLMQEARSAALPAALLTIELIALTMIARWKGGSDAPEEEAAAQAVEEPRLLAG